MIGIILPMEIMSLDHNSKFFIQIELLLLTILTFFLPGPDTWAVDFSDLTEATEALRELVEPKIASGESVHHFLGFTEDGKVFHGTTLWQAVRIVQSDFSPSSPADDVAGFYTIGSHGRALEYANQKFPGMRGRFTPVVLRYQVDMNRTLRVLILNEEIQGHPSFQYIRKHFFPNRNRMWSHLASSLDLDATIDFPYPVFFTSRALIGPHSLPEMLEMLGVMKDEDEVVQIGVHGTWSSSETASLALQALDSTTCREELGIVELNRGN